MRLLLDAHPFLWWIADDPHLSHRARRLIADGRNEVFVSVASTWEIAIKAGLKRVPMKEDPERFIPRHLEESGFIALPVQLAHALKVSALPDHHRDPFDRLIVAQAICEGMTLVTADEQIAPYPVKIIW